MEVDSLNLESTQVISFEDKLSPDFVHRFAREHGVPSLNAGPIGNEKELRSAASQVEIVNFGGRTLGDPFLAAAVNLEAVTQNYSHLLAKLQEYAEGLKENFLGLARYLQTKEGRLAKAVVTAGLVATLAASCNGERNTGQNYEFTATSPAITEVTHTPISSPTLTRTPETTFTPTKTLTPTETSTPTEKPQETIDLPLTDGGTFTVDKFDTTQEALDYMAKNSLWKNIDRNNLEGMDAWLKTKDAYSYYAGVKKIVGWAPGTEIDPPSSDKDFFSVSIDYVGGVKGGTLLTFETPDKKYSSIYIDVDAQTFISESQGYNTATPTSAPTIVNP
ncbi:MAG: hypothetical protein ABSC49_03365 [Candidatus Microgenomates bacterium]